mgnify:FL=1
MIESEVSFVARDTENGNHIQHIEGWAASPAIRDLIVLVREVTNIQSDIEIVAWRRIEDRPDWAITDAAFEHHDANF